MSLPPGIIVQAQGIRIPSRNVKRGSLLDICDRNISTSEVIRHNHMISVLTGNFLDEWVRGLAKRLSELPVRAAEAVIKKPQ